MLTVVAAAVRALVGHRTPIGDNGLIALRAHDVLTHAHPWFGTWTSASLNAGVDFNNPSPLHFDVLSLTVKTVGVSAGAVLGAAVVNIAAILIAIHHGKRFGGRIGEALMALAATGLAWTLGSELLVDIWQPHNLVLPFLAVLSCSAAIAAGRPQALPWAVGAASLVVGAHLSFIYVSLVPMAVGTAVCWWRLRTGNEQPGAMRRGLVWAGVVGLLAWAQPIIEQLFGPGRGNIGRVLEARNATGTPIGARLGLRVVSQVVALPPWWGRPSFSNSIPSTGFSADGQVRPTGLVGLAGAAIAMTVVVAVLGLLVVLAVRRHERSAAVLPGMALVVVVSSLFTAVQMPLSVIGLAPHQMRWLWPVSAFVWVAVGDAIVRAVQRRRGDEHTARVARLAALGAVCLLALLTLPTYTTDQGPSTDRAANDAIRSMMQQLDEVQLPGAAVFDVSTLRFAEPYSGPLLAVLLANDQPLKVTDEGFIRQLGERRRASGDEQWTVQLREGDTALALGSDETYLAQTTGPGATPVAVVLVPRSATP